MQARFVLLAGLIFSAAARLCAQEIAGELRLNIVDPSGAAVRTSIQVICAADGYNKVLKSNAEGALDIKHIPYGTYQVLIDQRGFAPASRLLEVHSPLPVDATIQLGVAPVVTQVDVAAQQTLLDPASSSSVARIGAAEIHERLSSLPGRSVQDLVVTQPGWLYEGNAVLHPRGSEYETQFVVDGIPLTDNRSPSFGPEIEADNLESVSIYTAGIPAEYGRKLGGVVDLDTQRQTDRGTHGQLVLSGGSYDTTDGYGQLQEASERNVFGVAASGSRSSHYLNPVVPENYTNNGTTGDFSAHFERDQTPNDRLSLGVWHELSRFEVPNELVQQQAGQLQTGDNFETMGTARYQHIVSPDSMFALSGMVRNHANDLYSNADSTPIIAFEHNYFNEGHFRGTFSLHHDRHDLKAGIESDTTFLHEDFSYTITDPSQFDDDTPGTLPPLIQQRPDLEQAAFIEDVFHLNKWTLSAGLRWDHYQLLLNQNALSPRISIGRYLPSLCMVLHASFDRVFQTPSSENILISSSNQISALDYPFLHLPVQPSKGNYYEGGLSQALLHNARLDINFYRRDLRNYADDDQLLNTGVSYPIAFNRAVIYGAEGKLDLIHLHRLDGYLSYSYMVGNAWFPVTGGLFLGDDAATAVTQLNGHFPDSQDQRNTVSTRFQYRISRRITLAAGAQYGSGLPFEYGGSEDDALAEYGPAVISRINFTRGRIRPLLAVNSSLGYELYTRDKTTVHLQIDGENLNNRLNVIDFGGLFSGNAIAPARSVAARLTTTF